MLNWLRKIPHPGYGKCGGANRDCSISKPRDWMDLAFEEHDNDLQSASQKVTKVLRDLAKNNADIKLGKALRKGDPKKLNKEIWGRIYLFGAKIAFKDK